ncbi:MAG: nucleoside triphosphate pyrophosphohydrolase [Eubacteriales bacterium]
MSQINEFEYLSTKKESYNFDDLCLLARLLRADGGCPWDREQTHKSIRKDIIEETYEVIEAIDKEDAKLMREELGDLLWQIVFHAELEREEGRSDMNDIIHDICAKLVHRHPHVFGNVVANTSDAVLSNWEKIKTEEKHRDTVTSKLESVPPALPALMRAQKVGKRAPFFDFPDAHSVMNKLDEELGELKTAVHERDSAAIDEEFGDVLFTAVSLARKLDLDAEESLTRATNKFIKRFSALEEEVLKEGKDITTLSMEELDAVWDRIKHK